MKTEFRKYCKAIDLSDILIKRVDKIISDYKKFLDEEILDIFISEQRREDGTNMYLSLWIFTDSYICEATDFMTKFEYDIAAHKKRMQIISLKKNNYELGGKPTLDSNLMLFARFVESDNLHCSLKASGNNCTYLFSIF